MPTTTSSFASCSASRPIDYFQHMVTNGALLLFTFFMITDPMTTPNHAKARIAWAVMVGLLTFALNHLFILNSGAPIWAPRQERSPPAW